MVNYFHYLFAFLAFSVAQALLTLNLMSGSPFFFNLPGGPEAATLTMVELIIDDSFIPDIDLENELSPSKFGIKEPIRGEGGLTSGT